MPKAVLAKESPTATELAAEAFALPWIDVADLATESLVVLDREKRIRIANAAFERMFQYAKADWQGRLLSELNGGEWNTPSLTKLLDEAAQQRQTSHSLEVQVNFPRVGCKWLQIRTRLITLSGELGDAFLVSINDLTAQKQTETLLAETETQRQIILNSVPAIIGYIDASLCYRLANRAYERWFGIPHEQIVGKSLQEVWGEELVSGLTPYLNTVLSGQPVTFEREYPNKRMLQVVYTPDCDSNRQVRGFFVLGNDTTERRAAEKQLQNEKQAQAALALLGEQLRRFSSESEMEQAATEIVGSALNAEWAAFARLDARSGLLIVDRVWNRSGESVGSINLNIAQFGQEAKQGLERGELLVTSSGTEERQHTSVLMPRLENGTLSSVFVLRDRHGRTWTDADLALIRRATEYTADAIARERTITEWRQSEQFIRSVLQSTPDCVKIIDLNGRLVGMNEGGCRQMEIDNLPSMLNKPWAEFWANNSDAAELAIVEAKNGNSFRFEGFCPTLKGTPKWWEVLVTPIRDANGRPFQILSVSRDITERQKTEQERARLTQELKRSNEELSQFAHTVAHDLQAPLRGVVNFAQLLQRRAKAKLSKDEQELSEEIVQSGRRLQELVQALLKFAQVGKGKIERRPVDLNHVVQSALGALQLQIEEHHATIHKGPLPTISGDAVQLEQLLQNLLSNALKYQRPNVNPVVHITGVQRGDNYVISVADNGEGIATEHLKLVFEPLQRLHGAEVPGTGLGLATCQRIVQRHGGEIWAESTPGIGSTFSFSLPIHVSPDA